MATLITLVISAIICGVIGAGIGNLAHKNNSLIGGFLGALLGPVGWIIVAVLPPEAAKAEPKAAKAAKAKGSGTDVTKIIFGAIGVCVLLLGGLVFFISRM